LKQKLNRFADILAGISNKSQHNDEHVLLVDGLNLFLRNFTVINLLNQNAEHIGGLVGSMLSLGYAIKVNNPTKVIVVFDGVGGSNSRKYLYPDYKANRHKTRVTNYSSFSSREEEDESISNQIGRLVNYFQCLPISMICVDGLEADDIIGYLTAEYENNSNTSAITIMSADQDFLQLVSKKTSVYSPVKKKIYKSEDVLREFNVTTENFLMRKVLMGDMSDNVPGVPKLGPKKLEKLFPELSSSTKISLQEIINKSKNGNHQLYNAIYGQKHQLEINHKIMNLKDLPISSENKEIINMVKDNTNLKIDTRSFLTMYYNDELGTAIKGVETWLSSVFAYLANFK
jgi:DNA polymerase-1